MLSIIVLSIIASIIGIFSNQVNPMTEFTSIHGEVIKLYDKGLYQLDSMSMATQVIAQDIITLIFAIPLLCYALKVSNKGHLKDD